ncbi:type II secretion system protein N [Mangrovitalea sediminis]|uniref:type II secretion system protein N n=1 Tax=Mangrovitalea sediminis TaxID=1982043 RepID=UPI000BE60ECF|nr:type II secretion system protein N [Mangrovitalea sediminis]
MATAVQQSGRVNGAGGFPARLAIILANLFLILMFVEGGWLLGKFTWTLAWSAGPVASPYVGGVSNGTVSALPEVRLDELNLFGLGQSSQGVPQVISATAPQTQLQLVLEGVLVGQRGEESGAIVAQNGGDTEYYKVGDMLPGNAKLIEVQSDKILLRRAGRVEALSFADAEKERQAIEAARTASPGSVLAEASSQLANNPQAALASAGLQAVKPGLPAGYVFNGNNPMLSALDLKKGDVIRSVNGHNLGDIQQDRQMLQQWYEQGQLQIEVQRGDTQFTLTYPLHP